MKGLTYLLVLLSLLGIGPGLARAGFIVSSTFDLGNEGWTARALGGDFQARTWHNAGGNPGGHVRAVDRHEGLSWFWLAPAKFLGDVSAAYGGTLTYDERVVQGDIGPSNGPGGDIRLEGSGLLLILNTSYLPTRDWTSASVSLVETAGWHLNDINGPTPTRAEFQMVLASLTSLRIRGEYSLDLDIADLDNVVLNSPNAVPEPGSLTLLGVGAACLLTGYVRRCRKPRRD